MLVEEIPSDNKQLPGIWKRAQLDYFVSNSPNIADKHENADPLDHGS